MSESAVGEIIEGLWRFEALHPEWTEQEGGEDGWEEAVDRLLADRGGCAGVIRTCHWHQRSTGLTNLPLRHVLVSHGPLVLDNGLESLRAATA